MSPSSMLDLSQRIYQDQNTALKYGKYRAKLGPGQYQQYGDTCNFECRRFLHCETSTSDYAEWNACRNHDFMDLTDPMSALMIYLTYPWFTQN